MSDFVVVHLSDAHIGHPDWTEDTNEVLDALLEDLTIMRGRLRVPDLVVFSGDLAYSGKDEEYEKAGRWLKHVFERLGVSQREPCVLFVPGNHDVNRARIEHSDLKYLRGELRRSWFAEEPSLRKDISSRTDIWKRRLLRHAAWRKLLEKLGSPVIQPDEDMATIETLTLPNGKTVGVAALNSAWASADRNDKDQLYIGEHLVTKAWNQVRNCDLKLLVTHHPPEWLCGHETQSFRERQLRFDIYLCGHEHSFVLREEQVGTRPTLLLQGGAVYQGSRELNGYAWITTDLQSGKTTFHGRVYEREGRSEWIEKTNGSFNQHGTAERYLKLTNSTLVTSQAPTKVTPSAAGEAEPQCAHESLNSFLSFLQTPSTFFRWESHGFDQVTTPPVVYWPVRLRLPTAIHAAQAYAAAGLQQRGAEIALVLDDLGRVDPNAMREFKSAVQRWFHSVGGNFAAISIQTMEAALAGDSPDIKHLWTRMREWLASHADNNLQDVLKVAKFISPDATAAEIQWSEIADKKPRRLLSPALVWTFLGQVMRKYGEKHRYITLGGFDERPLWEAWRKCVKGDVNAPVAHLYNPKLKGSDNKTMRMSDAEAAQQLRVVPVHERLVWTSRQDVAQMLADALRDGEMSSHEEQLPHWVFDCCMRLPSTVAKDGLAYIEIDGSRFKDVQSLQSVAPRKIADALANRIWKYFG